MNNYFEYVSKWLEQRKENIAIQDRWIVEEFASWLEKNYQPTEQITLDNVKVRIKCDL